MSLRRTTLYALLIVAVWLTTPITVFKIADIQPVEVLLLIILTCTVLTLLGEGQLILRREIAPMLMHYCIFASLALLLAVFSLRLTFYPPTVVSGDLLKTAPFLSIARLTQISLCVGSFILFANIISSDRRLLLLAVSLYIWIGVINALYAIASWLSLTYFGIHLYGAYSPGSFELARARALFNEGGPYGLYALSVLTIALFNRYVLKRMAPIRLWLCVVLPVGASLLLSQSKAAAVCLVALFGWRALARLRFRYIFAGAVVTGLFIVATPLLDGLANYWYAYEHFSQLASLHPNDTSLMAGRIAALAVMPEIVKAHPLLGVGLGNYSLVRADPRLGIPAIDRWDLPGLGVFSYIGDLGIPLFLYLLWIISMPLRMLIGKRQPDTLLMLLGYQFLAQLIDVQITFFYPWAVAAIAVGYYMSSRGP